MEHGFLAVQYPNNPKIFYFKNILEGLQVGDPVVVDTIRGYQVATIVDMPETVDRHVGRWSVDKVDLTTFNKIQEIRTKEKEDKAKKRELKKQIRFLFDENVMPVLLEKYAQEDEELAKLLEEYQSL